MEKQIIRRVITRCVKDEIVHICARWNILSKENLSEIDIRKPKIRIAEDIYAITEGDGLDIISAGELDLIHSQIHANSRKWNSYELVGQEKNHYLSSPELFQKALLSKLKLFFDKVYVNVNLFSGALWGRIHVIDRKYPDVYKPNDVVYLVHYPKTQFVFLTKIRAKDEETLKEGLLPVFKADSITELNLVGRHVSSLVELALNKHSQGSFGQYRSIEERENPYVRRTKKRKASPEPAKPCDKRLKGENQEDVAQRSELLDGVFGKTEQPTLEKLEYKMHVKFRGAKYAPEMAKSNKPFRCRIKFEGTSVLEGIKNLGKAGVAAVPMPTHLTKVNSLAKNFFFIRDKTASDKS